MSTKELSEDDVLIALENYVVEGKSGPEIEVDVDGGLHTLTPRPIYEFERDILDDVIGSTIAGNVSGAAVPIKGRWVHGWLNAKFDDYINNIWHGYQFFVKYVEAETEKIENISSQSRNPGTYDSMYRYIRVLEDIGLVERYKREEVPEENYDFNVPEEFRTRTFVRLDASYEGNEKLWNDPIGSLYVDGDVEKQEDESEDEESPTMGDIIDEADTTEGGSSTERSTDSPTMGDIIEETESDSEDSETEEQERPTPQSTYDLPDEEVSITDFPDLDQIPLFLELHFQEAVENAFEQAAIQPDDLNPSDLELGRIAIVGPWGSGDAIPGQSPLDIYIGIVNTTTNMSPGFIPPGINRELSEKLNRNNIFQSVFPEYNIISTFKPSFRNQLKRHVNIEQEYSKYYDYSTGEVKEV